MVVEKQLRMITHAPESAEFQERAEKHEVEPQERFLHESMEEANKRIFNEAWRSVDHLRLAFDFIMRLQDERIEAMRNNEQVLDELEADIQMARSKKAVEDILTKERRVFNFPKTKTWYAGKPAASMHEADTVTAGERYIFWTDVEQKYLTFQEYVRQAFGKQLAKKGMAKGLIETQAPMHPFVNFSARNWLSKEGGKLSSRLSVEEKRAAKLAGLKAISDAKAMAFEHFASNYTGISHNITRVNKIIQSVLGTVAVAGQATHGVPAAKINTYLDAYQREIANIGKYPAAARLAMIRPHKFFVSGGPDQLAELLWWAREAIEEIKIKEAQRLRNVDLLDINSGLVGRMAGVDPQGASVAKNGLKVGNDLLKVMMLAALRALAAYKHKKKRGGG